MGTTGMGGTEGNALGASAPPYTWNSLLWAVLLPATSLGGAVLGLYLWLPVGLVIAMLATATAAIVAGGTWNRAGAAVVATASTLALVLFSGSVLHESYVKRFGERTDVLVAGVEERVRVKSNEFSCRVVDASGTARELGSEQNCHGQFESGQRAFLFEDPLGALEPWLDASADPALDVTDLGGVGALFAVAVASLFYAGIRRRSDQEMAAKKLRKHGPPRRSES